MFNFQIFEKIPVIGIIRGLSEKDVEAIVPLYLEAGFTTLEITMNTPHVGKIITTLRGTYPQLNVGAGTVCSLEELKVALDAGASFIVCPIINEKVIETCVQKNIPVFPGAYTPTEIYYAWQRGATAVKVFPATSLSPAYIKDVLSPLPFLKLIPTGGVSLENVKAFFKAGAYGVGMGSSLFDPKIIEKGDFEGLYRHFKKLYTTIL